MGASPFEELWTVRALPYTVGFLNPPRAHDSLAPDIPASAPESVAISREYPHDAGPVVIS